MTALAYAHRRRHSSARLQAIATDPLRRQTLILGGALLMTTLPACGGSDGSTPLPAADTTLDDEQVTLEINMVDSATGGGYNVADGRRLQAMGGTRSTLIWNGPHPDDRDPHGISTDVIVKLGDWYPFKAEFLRLIRIADGPPFPGKASFGRRLPIPLVSPEHIAVIERMGVTAGQSNRALDIGIINAGGVMITVSHEQARTVTAGETLVLTPNYAWTVIAVHPAEGELPGYAELRLDVTP